MSDKPQCSKCGEHVEYLLDDGVCNSCLQDHLSEE